MTHVAIRGKRWNTVSLSPGCPQTPCVARDVFEFLILCCDCRLVPPHPVYALLPVLRRLSGFPSSSGLCFTLHITAKIEMLHLRVSALFPVAWTCFSVQQETATCTWTNTKQTFRIINYGLDAGMKVKWPDMENVSTSAWPSRHLPSPVFSLPGAFLKLGFPMYAREPRTDLWFPVASWRHAGPAGWYDRHVSAGISQGEAQDARVGAGRCVCGRHGMTTW